MASQYNKMGNDLLKIPVFQKTIERCHAILATKNLDLTNILTSEDETIFTNVLHSFVGIGAVQIGMINILREIGLEPDYVMGSSFGEVTTGYADGGFTEEQTILSAYYRGLVTLQGRTIEGGMGFVGLGSEKISKILPEDIDNAAHMDPNATCIAGPKASVETFVDKMRSENCYAALIQTAGIAFHSRYIAHLGPQLEKLMKEIVPEPIPRSKKWISTSVKPSELNKPDAQACCAEYYANNLVGCVFLEESFRILPKNCIVLEVAPHCLLRGALKNNLPDGIHVALGDKTKSNGVKVFLEALQALSENGIKVDWKRVLDVFDNNL